MTEVTPTTRQKIGNSYIWAIIALGAGVCAFSLHRLPILQLGWPYLILSVVTVAVASRIVINFFRFESGVSASDVFIFLTVLVFDGEAAILLGSAESYFASLRITRTQRVRLFNASAMACSTFLTVWVLRFVFGPLVGLPDSGFDRLIIAACGMALLQYFANSGLVAVAGALRANKPVWETWKKHYLWTSITYFAGASAAVIIAKLINEVGFYAVISTVPIVAIIYLTYITYTKNVETAAVQAEQAERHVAELQESEARFHSAFDHAPIGMALVAPDGRWLQVNRSMCEIVGYAEEELLEMNFQAITHPEDLGRFLSHLNDLLGERSLSGQVEKRYFHKRGHEVWVLIGISLIRDPLSKASRLIFQIQDITDRKLAEERLLHDAFHDALTGLPNRPWFMEQLKVALDNFKRRKDRLFAVIFIDLDRFKVINDSIGHMVGDQLLIGIAARLQKCLRPGDKVARLGGDEFTILLNGIKDVSDVIEVAERIQKEVAQPFILSGYETFTTASIGIAVADSGYSRPEDILRDADTAMYQAKSLGKARYAIFDKEMHARAMNLLQLENDLRRAIERGEFVVQYQPIIALATGDLAGFEALVRWQHPLRGLIPPSQFISLAEETGLILPLGQWVLQEACRQMRRWQQQFSLEAPLAVAVNISNKQFAYTRLLQQIRHTLDSSGLDPRRLKLEITESVVMENIESAATTLEQLRALGVELSIDDFGTGYSSLSYLHRLPIDTLKIDRSFVSQIDQNNENKEIVRTIVMLAKKLGMAVIAEGVETAEQLKELKELQCDGGQGYLFSRPVDAEEAARLIQKMLRASALEPYAEAQCDDTVFEPLASEYSM